MELIIDFTKSIHQNAADYFEQVKRIRKKIERAKEVVKQYKEKLKSIQSIGSEGSAKNSKSNLKHKEKCNDMVSLTRKKFWYEKFRWFFSSTGFLVIGGRDATTNEIIIKKYTDKDDLVFHTDLAGSPFFVIKKRYFYDNFGTAPIDKDQEIDQKTKEQVANATACFSKAWKLGLSILEVFYVTPNQLSKKPKSGEYLTKGSFVVYGKVNYMTGIVDRCCLGIERLKYEDKEYYRVISGPEDAIANYTIFYFRLRPGKCRRGEIADRICKILNKKKGIKVDKDEIIRALPGEADIEEHIDAEKIRLFSMDRGQAKDGNRKK